MEEHRNCGAIQGKKSSWGTGGLLGARMTLESGLVFGKHEDETSDSGSEIKPGRGSHETRFCNWIYRHSWEISRCGRIHIVRMVI